MRTIKLLAALLIVFGLVAGLTGNPVEAVQLPKAPQFTIEQKADGNDRLFVVRWEDVVPGSQMYIGISIPVAERGKCKITDASVDDSGGLKDPPGWDDDNLLVSNTEISADFSSGDIDETGQGKATLRLEGKPACNMYDLKVMFSANSGKGPPIVGEGQTRLGAGKQTLNISPIVRIQVGKAKPFCQSKKLGREVEAGLKAEVTTIQVKSEERTTTYTVGETMMTSHSTTIELSLRNSINAQISVELITLGRATEVGLTTSTTFQKSVTLSESFAIQNRKFESTATQFKVELQPGQAYQIFQVDKGIIYKGKVYFYDASETPVPFQIKEYTDSKVKLTETKKPPAKSLAPAFVPGFESGEFEGFFPILSADSGVSKAEVLDSLGSLEPTEGSYFVLLRAVSPDPDQPDPLSVSSLVSRDFYLPPEADVLFLDFNFLTNKFPPEPGSLPDVFQVSLEPSSRVEMEKGMEWEIDTASVDEWQHATGTNLFSRQMGFYPLSLDVSDLAGHPEPLQLTFTLLVPEYVEGRDGGVLLDKILFLDQDGNLLSPIAVEGAAPEEASAASELIAQGGLLASQSRLNEAIERYAQAATLEPENARAYARWGQALLFVPDLEAEALDKCLRAVELEEDNPDFLALLAWACDWNGRYEEAAAIAQQALEIDPSHAEALAMLAEAYADLGRLEEALESAQQAVALGDSNPHVHRNLGYVLYMAGQYEEALAEYQRAVELEPDFFYWHEATGTILLYQLKEYEEAIQEFEQVIALYPDSYRAYNYIGVCYWWLERYDEAISYYQKAIDLKPDFTWPYSNMGLVYVRQGRCDLAVPLFEKALELYPDNIEAQSGLEECGQ